ncbi:hypothetical protein [Spiroplasma endosymbiont of Amphimallon solstitiale]|uniref:hypothetical protein n=1 Tax=Spiroplasma endosymbiont of Amphimallon solstitiale TaxID=3066288 RepID=UPI00313E3460
MFKVQLANIEKGRIIPDKNNKGQTLKFDVLKFVEINKQTGWATGQTRDKWYNPDIISDFNNCLSAVDLKVGNFYSLELDLSGNIKKLSNWK